MKFKNLFLAVLLSFGFLFATAQEVAKGDKVLNFSVGLGNALYSGVGYTGSIPPISGSFEFVIKDDLFDGDGAIGVGGYLGYSSYDRKDSIYGYDYVDEFSDIIIGPRGYLHYSLVEKLDTYGGVVRNAWGHRSNLGTTSNRNFYYYERKCNYLQRYC